MNSRSKGKRGELEFAAFLRAHGFDARRGQQFAGGTESPDVLSAALHWLHIEVKRVEQFNLGAACAQAARDAGGKPWVVAHRRNRGPWFITVDSDECSRLMRRSVPFFDLWPMTGPRPITMDAELFFQFLRNAPEVRNRHEVDLTDSPPPCASARSETISDVQPHVHGQPTTPTDKQHETENQQWEL